MPSLTQHSDVGVTDELEVHVDNKYYTARLKCITKEGEEARQHELPEQHEFDAAVLVVDTLDAHSLAIVKAQLSHLAERNVSVLVVADAAPAQTP